MILGTKLMGFRGWKVGKLGDMLDPLETKQIHGSNPTKLHHTNKSQKRIGAIFVGNFRIWDKINKTRLENKEGRLRNCDQRGLLWQDDVGWNPIRPIFHERSRSHEEHEEHMGTHEGKHERITQTNKIRSHIC